MPSYNRSPRKGQGYEFLEFVFYDKSFKGAVLKLRDKWDIYPEDIVADTHPDGYDIDHWFFNEDFEDDVLQLMKKLNIPLKWREPVTLHIITDGLGNVSHNFSQEGSGVYLKPEDNDWFTITVGPQATFKDLLSAWNSILDLRDQPIRKDRHKDNSRRDLMILRLHKQGKKAKEITRILKENKMEASSSVIYKIISQKKKRYGLK